MLRVERVVAERLYRVHVHHVLEVGIIPHFNFLNFMRGAETVKEVDERHFALNGRKVRDGSQIHDFLRVAFRKHGKTRLAACIHVRVVAKNIQGLRGNGTGRHMEHRGQLLRGNLKHIRYHQEQALRSRKGRGERTARKRTVHRSRRACFRFHFNDFHLRAEDVFLTGGRPLVNVIRHG